ncbi:MAG: family metallopeptidase [Herbinix sp.]|nr:family metallopeptidase [Herbinix sp.]
MNKESIEIKSAAEPEKRIFPTLSTTERDRRWEQTRAFMREQGLSVLVGIGGFNTNRLQPYLANISGAGGAVVFPLDSAPVYLGSAWDVGINYDNAQRGIEPWIKDTRACFDPIGSVGEVLEERGLKKARIGVFGLTHAMIPIGGSSTFPNGSQLMEVLQGAEIVDVTTKFGLTMLKKSPEELEMVRHAAKACERAVQALVDACHVGALETDLFAAVVGALAIEGCDPSPGTLNITIKPEAMGFMGGLQWFYPQSQPQALEVGDVVEVEIFAWYGGVDSQAQASIVIGEPDAERLHLADVALRSYEAGVAQIRPGVKFSSVWKAMRQVILDEGCWVGSPILHSLSPVLLVGEMNAGLMEANVDPIFKAPAFVPGYNDEEVFLGEGMVLAVEPCVALGYKKAMAGGAVIVTRDGAEELNSLPFQMPVIR